MSLFPVIVVFGLSFPPIFFELLLSLAIFWLVRWLTAGAGIAYVPLMWVINEINRGELEILLPRYQSDPRPVYALYTEKDKLPLKVQVVINSLTDYFVEVGKLFQEMHGRGKEK